MQVNIPVKPAEVSTFGTMFRSDAFQRIMAFASLVLLIIVSAIISPYFLTPNNIVSILISTAVNGILALGVTFVIISGGIDLSIGTVMSFSAVMSAVFITNAGLPTFMGVIGGIGAGVLAGLLNGVLIAKLKLPPFIATLGMLNVAKGLSLIVSGVKPMYYPDTSGFSLISLGKIVPGFPIPNAVLILFGATIVASIILSKTILGRYTFALGSNEEAARLSGINVDAWKIGVYTLCGAFAGLAGVIIAARLNSAQPATGQGYELNAIAAAVIGGTSLSGGEGTIIGTLIGAFLLSTLTDILTLKGVPGEWQILVTGVIVVMAVFLDIVRRRAV